MYVSCSFWFYNGVTTAGLRKLFNSGKLSELDKSKLRLCVSVKGGLLERCPALHVCLLTQDAYDQRHQWNEAATDEAEKYQLRKDGNFGVIVDMRNVF